VAPIRIGRFYPTTFALEDPESGEIRTVPCRVRRFNKEQFETFKADYATVTDPPSNRVLLVRRQEGDEQQRDEKTGQFTVSDAKIRARRLEELTPDQRTAYDTQNKADEAFAEQFFRQAVIDHVTFPDGVLEAEDEAGAVIVIRTGAEFVAQFPSRFDLLNQLTLAIIRENTMSPDEKKVQRSLSALKSSYGRQLQEVLGATPAATADAAGSAASAPSDIAMATLATTPSGLEVVGSR